jgi:Protein of unknown function (DUF3618)
VSPRDPEQIQREIETSRTDLASALDELVDRVSPKRLAGQARDTTATWVQTPVGMAVVAGAALLVVLGVVRRVRKH